MNIDQIFQPYADDAVLTEAEEVELIARAKAGDESATLTLMSAYGRALRAALRNGGADGERSAVNDRAAFGTSNASVEDGRQAAIVGFMEALHAHDPEQNPRLAGVLPGRLAEAIRGATVARSEFAIPARTLTRFFAVMEAAEWDLREALSVCQSFDMSPDTLLRIYLATGSESLEGRSADDEDGGPSASGHGETSLWDDGREAFADVEDAILVGMAFDAVDYEEEMVTRYYYGFETPNPLLSDAAVVQAWSEAAFGPERVAAGETIISRATAQRRRASALAAMREALYGSLED